MEIFKRIMETILSISYMGGEEMDEQMRVATFFSLRRTNISDLIDFLIQKSLVPEETPVKGALRKRKVLLETDEEGKKIWRALLIIKNGDLFTLAVSADKGQP